MSMKLGVFVLSLILFCFIFAGWLGMGAYYIGKPVVPVWGKVFLLLSSANIEPACLPCLKIGWCFAGLTFALIGLWLLSLSIREWRISRSASENESS